MLTRTKRYAVTFGHAFTLEGIERSLPAGAYEVVSDEELIEGLSFPVYRRVSTQIMLPAQSRGVCAGEMMCVSSAARAAALSRDKAMTAPVKDK